MGFLWTGLLAGLGGAVLALVGTFATAWPKLPPQRLQQPRLGQLVAFRPNSITVTPQPLLRALEAAPEPPPVLNRATSDQQVAH